MVTLDELLELGHEHAADILLPSHREKDPENDSTLIPTFVLVKENDHRDIIGCQWGDKEDKKKMLLGIGLEVMASDPRVIAYSFLSECWTASYKQGEKIQSEARKAPHRKEAVICIASDGETHKYGSWELGRDVHGKCVSLTVAEQPVKFTSWMIDLIDRSLRLRKLMGKPLPFGFADREQHPRRF